MLATLMLIQEEPQLVLPGHPTWYRPQPTIQDVALIPPEERLIPIIAA